MLVLTRKPGQAVQIDLMEDLDPRTPVGELFAQGPIEIVVTDVRGEQVKLGLTADPCFRIRQPLPALLYLPPSMAVACAKNSAPTPRPPTTSPVPPPAGVEP